jgi:3-methylcrotonyl-CoA carboxylase alpha subunit
MLQKMKMEHTIVAPIDGAVVAVHYGEGDLVEEGVDLIDIAPDERRVRAAGEKR